MVISVKNGEDSPEYRAMHDLVKNANSKDYCNERGFKQKLIDILYRLGYYRDNRTIFEEQKEE